ncbi:secretory immunoglobulin A-binding protein EsiB-like isoform X1 [Anser cygnoides]|uniref:secretory immunoglobulin A-binding protein EsiB-like isoform X1 n=1 Tax=Anser cygnoides TaxID=8845 RepID=UPI0034D2BE66
MGAGSGSASKVTLIFCGSVRLSAHSSLGNSFGRLYSLDEVFALAGRQLLSLLAPPLLQLLAVAAAGLLLLYIALCYQDFHFHVAQAYARLGYPHAQHIVGQRYLQGAEVEKSEALAMRWFRQAAGQGHPHSSFNLALGALRNMTAALEEGEVEKLLGVAAAHGLQEAQELLENILKSQNLP